MISQKKILVALVSFIIAFGFSIPSQAVIEKKLCILKISDILQHLPEKGNTIAIFDWDKTISAEEGEYQASRSGQGRYLRSYQSAAQKGY